MSAQPTTAGLINSPDPHQDRPAANAGAPNPTSCLLTLVRKLIDYGRQLASTLQQRTAATDLADTTHRFGTLDIAEILARITRGLLRAAALEARLTSRLARQPDAPAAKPATRTAASPRQPRPARPAAPNAIAPDTGLARLPTPADIAARLATGLDPVVRRRPIGAVFADICRDLGIVPNDPLWRELFPAIIFNGGKLLPLFKDLWQRLATRPIDPPTTDHQVGSTPYLPSAVTPGTGPP